MSSIYFKQVPTSDPALPTVIAFSIGNPTPDKMKRILSLYETPGHYLMGSFEAHTLIGVIGLEVQHEKTGIIKHIAVLPAYRLQGVGKGLIAYMMNHFRLQIICAETDEDAVAFYRSVGFSCQPFEGHYGKRYNCDCALLNKA